MEPVPSLSAVTPAASAASSRAREMHKDALAPATRKMYSTNLAFCFRHFMEKKPSVFADAFIRRAAPLSLAAINGAWVRQLLDSPEQAEFPFNDSFSCEVFEEYLASLCKKDGVPVSNAALSGHRSAMNHLFTVFRRPPPEGFGLSLKEFFRGSLRQEAQRKADGLQDLEEGKAPLKFGPYCEFDVSREQHD